MNLIDWNDDFSVNIKVIDEQHKKLVDLVNKLHAAMMQGQGETLVHKILDALVDYTNYHFTDEEKLLEEHDYPNHDKHQEEHNKLLQDVLDFKIRQQANNEKLSPEMLNFLNVWLTNHILKSDRAFSAFLRDKGVR
jgi:hemerythrin